LSVHHADQFKEFAEAEQEKKTVLKQKLDESGRGKCYTEILPLATLFPFVTVQCLMLSTWCKWHNGSVQLIFKTLQTQTM